MVRRGFTLVELLVVIAIMAILSGLIVAGVAAAQRGAKSRKCEAILAAIGQGLELTAAEHGGLPAPCEHPLAGSAPPRTLFLRADGSALVATGEALVGPSPAQVLAGVRTRVLLSDDRHADPDHPLLYGMHRGRIGVLGAPGATTRYRQLPRPSSAAGGLVADRNLDGDYTTADYTDEQHLVAPAHVAGAAQRALDAALGSSGAAGELTRLGALRAPVDDTSLVRGGRVWSDGVATPSWKAGRMRDGVIASGADAGRPRWLLYRLRGVAVYDPWQREILYTCSAGGKPTLRSAGPDGVFAWDPGSDRTLATAATASGPTGDDRDGSRDNLVLGIDE